MKELIAYVPQLEIILYDGKSLYLPLHKKGDLIKAINTQKFIEISEMIINTREIKQVVPFTGNIDWVKGLDVETVSKIKERIKQYKSNLRRKPPLKTIYKWIDKVKAGEAL